METLLRILGIALLLLAIAASVVWCSVVPPEPLALPERGGRFENLTLVNPGLEHRAGVSVQIEDDRIVAIEDDGDGSDGFALPGLIDMHVHFPPDSGLGQSALYSFLFLYHGVTSVRDLGDVDGSATTPAREGVLSGAFPGPRIFACGPFVDGDPALWPNTRLANTPDEARRIVNELADAGFDCIKAYNNLLPETLVALRETAHARELPLVGHVSRFTPFDESGLDDIQHMTGLPPHPLGDERGFPANQVDWKKVDEAREDFIIARSLELGIAHTPTLVTTDRLLAQRHYETLREAPDALLMPRFYRDVVWSPQEGLPMLRELDEEVFGLLREAQRARMRLVRKLHRAGVAVYAGTDVSIPFVTPGASLHRELRLLKQAGLDPEEAWAIATNIPGRSLPDGIGQLREGGPADLLIFRRDPTQDLAALETLDAVVADGRVYTRAALDAQLARYQKHAEGALFDALSTMAARRLMDQIFEGD